MSSILRLEEPRQFDALVNFLARRLPDWDYRQTAAEESGLPGAQYAGDPKTGWRTLVKEAVEQNRVVELIHAAATLRREDPDLARLASGADVGTLTLPSSMERVAPFLAVGGVALIGALGLAGIVAAGSMILGGDAAETTPTAAPAIVAATPAPTESAQDAFVAAVQADVAKNSADADSSEGDDGGPGKAPEPEAAPTIVPVTPEKATSGWTAEKVGAQACTHPRGETLGYVFYNMRAPRSADEVWTLPRDLNVRTDYPRRENRWNIQNSEIVCVLLAGSQLELHPNAPAIRVEGGAWWVPVVGGAATSPK